MKFLDEISYIVLLEDWEISPSKLKLLDRKLGGGQFGIVRQAIFTGDKGEPETVAVKTVKGTHLFELHQHRYHTDRLFPLIKCKQKNRNCNINVIVMLYILTTLIPSLNSYMCETLHCNVQYLH